MVLDRVASAALLLLCVATVVSADTDIQTIAVGPDLLFGLSIGAFLIGMVIFAVMMLDDIQASDRLGQPKVELSGAAH